MFATVEPPIERPSDIFLCVRKATLFKADWQAARSLPTFVTFSGMMSSVSIDFEAWLSPNWKTDSPRVVSSSHSSRLTAEMKES